MKRFCEELAPVVHDIVVSSIMQCKYPTAYKHALVSPIPKVRPPKDIDNDFRQVSVLPQLAKVLEKIQLSLNNEALRAKDNQHAFRSGRSTMSALITTSQIWFDSTDNSNTGRNGVHALFIDFRKAFDLVNHRILMEKLAQRNINKHLWIWIKSFLEGRTQQVRLGDVRSFTALCPAGVPQGSVISPTLFNIHIDDLENAIQNQINVNTCKYADDCTMHICLKSGETSEMQSVLDSVIYWANDNKLMLNAKKTKDMWINFRQVPEPPLLQIGSTGIERVEQFKLLGVWFQNDLKWNVHVDSITKKASKRIFYLRECRRAQLPSEVGLNIYTTLIRPVLEYGAPVLGGIPSYLKEEIERIQRRCLRIIGLPRDYLPALETRRNEATAREFQNIRNDSNHVLHDRAVETKAYTYNLRPKRSYLNLPFSGTSRHQNSFLPRALKFN